MDYKKDVPRHKHSAEDSSVQERPSKQQRHSEISSSTTDVHSSGLPELLPEIHLNDSHHRSFRLKRKIVGHSATNTPTCWISDSICNLCFQFIKTFLRKQMKESSKKQWRSRKFPDIGREYRPVFRHYTTTRALLRSVEAGCSVCELITKSTHFQDGCQMVLSPLDLPEEGDYDEGQFGITPQHEDRFTAVPLKVMRIVPELPLNCDMLEFVLATDEDECRSSPAELETYPRASSASEECFEQLRTWHKKCLETHEECVRLSSHMPIRLLDIAPSGDDSDFIQLQDTKNLDNVSYVALSYCWGPASNVVTTKASLEKHVNGIPLTALPEVLRDAVIVTRKLSLRYLWIDALCILQDDESEWVTEAEKMSDVYGGATITISAMSSSQTTEGFLTDRNLSVVRVGHAILSHGTWMDDMQLFIRRIPRSVKEELRYCSLNQRAWALQERILSPSIIHYCPDQVIWECNTCQLVSESGAIVTSNENVIRLSDKTAVRDSLGLHDIWEYIVDAYSCRKLTKMGDRLRAISGIVTRLRTMGIRQGRYVAGLWENDLDFQLAWVVQKGDVISGSVPLEDSNIPTWSWARWNKPALTTKHQYLTSSLPKTPLFIFGDPEEDTRSHTVGQMVTFAAIKLTGYIQRIGPTAIWTETETSDDQNNGLKYDNLPGEYSTWHFDHGLTRAQNYFCLRLLEYCNGGYTPRIIYLVLKAGKSMDDHLPDPLRLPVYQRVGILVLKKMPSKYFQKPYQDILFESGKPLLTEGKYQDLLLV